MLVSLNNIRKYVSLDGLTPEEIAKGLTFSGLEVEEIKKLASGTELVIGQILECVAHPDSDHLHILKVDLGKKYGVEQIVCGAPNAREGLKVIVARVGSKLPGGEIKKSTIRGVESNGMCCSLLELGVNSKYLTDYQQSGIEELPEDAPVGDEKVLKYLHLDDVVLNINVLANRPDLLSVYNVAREIGAVFSREVEIPEIDPIETFKTKLKVGTQTEKCTQFSGKEIREITVRESPLWMQKYLMAMGIRSINNIVDIGNYVMLLTGQPLHMYDVDKLPKPELIARSDYEGDFVALDEKTYQVKNGDIVITSNKLPMCLGGVMGSLECAVDENTKNIYIEAASFDGATIRHTSNRLGLASESSTRFVKGTNHFQSEEVINLASQLIKDYCGAIEFSDIVTVQKEEQTSLKIPSNVDYINKRLGTEFSAKDIKGALERLNFKVMMNPNGYFIAVVPPYRLDITCAADLSEEVIRLLGFENVKSELPSLKTTLGALSLEQARLKEIRSFLLNNGLDECVTYSLLGKNEIKAMNLLHNEEAYKLLNPLTDEHEYFRTHLLHSLLKVASYNVAHQNKNLKLFETSHIQTKKGLHNNLAIVLVGSEERRGLLETIPFDFYHLKGLLEGLMEILGIEKSRYKFEELSAHKDELHPGKSADIIFQGQVIGRFGELHPNKVSEYDLGKNPVVVLELELDAILTAKVGGVKMSQISKFPSVTRDLAFVIDKNVPASDVIKSIKMVGKGLISDARIFDVFEGKLIASGKKSLAISITYQKADGTLLEKEVSEIEDKIKFELTKVYHAELRG